MEDLERLDDPELVRLAQQDPIFGLVTRSFDDEQINNTIAVGTQFVDFVRSACVLESLTQIRSAVDPDELYLLQRMLLKRLLESGLAGFGGAFSPLHSGNC